MNARRTKLIEEATKQFLAFAQQLTDEQLEALIASGPAHQRNLHFLHQFDAIRYLNGEFNKDDDI